MEFLLIFGVAMLVAVFIGTAVYFIMTYGTKEKTYEEAILEQRQRSEADVFFLGKSAKDKQKEKKLKKAGKKVKEKSEKASAAKETSDSVSDEGNETSAHPQLKNQHVAFVAEAAFIEDSAPTGNQEKKKKKVTKAKPILVNRDDTQLIVEANPPVDINHFDTIHPKDDFEMRRQSDVTSDQLNKKATQKLIEAEKVSSTNKSKKEKENAVTKAGKNQQAATKAEQVSNSVTKSEKPAVVAPKEDKEEKQTAEKPAEKTAVQEAPVVAVPRAPVASVPSAPVASVSSAPVASVPSKSSKKKKGEPSLQQMSSGRDAINANLLEPLIHKAELSRSEIQNLIDLLLNKQQGSETEVAEWNEGRQDPVMKLKKAYAEKEKALQEEQEVSLALQNKLREVRAEFNGASSRIKGITKQLEEKLSNRTNEMAAATAKFHHEKQSLTQQIQQLQHQLDQEHQLIRKYQEELGQAQNALQTQQTLEHHVANLTVKLQSQDQQIILLQQQVSENQGAVQQCELLSAQVAQLQEQLKNAQNSSQGEVHAKQKQLTEVKAVKEDIERQLSLARQREGQMNSELSKLKDVIALRQADIDKMSVEVSNLQEEKETLNAQVSLISQLQMEARQLREENESLAAQVTAVTERPAAEGRENGDITEEKQADGKLATDQLIRDLRERDSQVQELLEQVKQAEKSASSATDSLKSEISAYKVEIAQLSNELDQQRKKNDETENIVKSDIERKMREGLQRLFPFISVEDKVYEQWFSKFSAEVKKHVSELGNKQLPKPVPDEDQSAVIMELEKRNSQLSGMVTNYKTIIEDTEGMLNKLQQHVEAAETKWQQQLAEKEAELTTVTQERDKLRSNSSGDQSNIMQTQLVELNSKLQSIVTERNSLKSQVLSYEDTLATVDQLKSERDRLSSDLIAEQAKSVEQLNQLVKLKSLVEESESVVSKEKAISQQLREEIEKLKENHLAAPPSPVPSLQNHNGSTNGPSASVEPASAEKAASSKKKLSGWLKKKVVGSKSPQHSPNLSARGDDFLSNERMESS